MKKLFWLLTILLMLTFSGCRKDNGNNEPPPMLIPQEVKDYIVFKTGTYWIYEDSLTGLTDSVYVFDSYGDIDTLDGTGGNPLKGIIEWYIVKTRSSLDGYDYLYTINMSYSPQTYPTRVVVFRDKGKQGDYVGQSVCFRHPFEIGARQYWYDDTTILSNYIPSMTFNSFNFLNIVEISESRNVTEDDTQTRFLFSRNYGIINKEIVPNIHNWKIIRANIIQ